MARIPKSWYREDRQTYCVTIRGKRHDLGPDKKEADRLFHKLMAAKPEAPKPKSTSGLTVAEVFDRFLDCCEKHREARTYADYLDYGHSFLDHLEDKAAMPSGNLRPFHVVEWADSHEGWNDTTRRKAIIHVQRPFNFAVKLGYISDNPIRNVEKPQALRRDNLRRPTGAYYPSSLRESSPA